MNNELFDRANERYRLRDYRGALMAFTECLQDTYFPLTPGEMGLLYHQIGNCLVKLKNPREAIQASVSYTHLDVYKRQVMWVATMAAGRRRRTYSVNFGYMRRAQMVPPPHRRRPVRV